MADTPITLNGNATTEGQLTEKREELSHEKGIQIVEVKPGEFKTRLHD